MARETAQTDEAMIQRLRDVGLRVTGPRLEVLKVLSSGEHLDVEAITGAARARLGTLTSQAVYDMVRHFLDTGLVTKFDRPGWPAVFEIAGKPHQHALCVNCGRVANISVPRQELPDKRLRGWNLDSVEITFKGECPDCR
ncbi:Fur family transcriptional regulator [Streptomyces sp. HNM0574]|uniref:Fur family transcriptional regulator n=1 Tax=Streptomyces sp. HNM0574 TaxID=2714954 RepID=UPI00146D7E3A|nr:Fur family transcriptional regulator [Streptomyces sp. HNM0574]NLU66127.1 transcriptional repressor [Streptomyces sp. HNM0574]